MDKRETGFLSHGLPRRHFLGQVAAGMVAGGLPAWAMAQALGPPHSGQRAVSMGSKSAFIGVVF